jgi:hypothetical protein
MNARVLLDADMQTIGRWLLQGWRWWADEIRGLLPARSRGTRTGNTARFAMEQGALVAPAGGRSRAGAVPKPGTRVTIVIPPADCLIRSITRPAIGERDLRRMVAFEADALLPIPAGSALVATRVAGSAEAGKIRIQVAGLPIDKARAIAGVAAAAGLVPAAVVLEEEDRRAPPLDFAPGMREAGLLATRRSATTSLWGLVAALLLLNLTLWVWRDAARVARFERLVAEQQPAVAVAQKIARRGEQDQLLIARSLTLRRVHDPLRVLAAVGDALPQGAWLQRFVWDGETVRLAGYRPARADVATALRRSGRFSDVRNMGQETQATMPTGDPFDLAARVGR